MAISEFSIRNIPFNKPDTLVAMLGWELVTTDLGVPSLLPTDQKMSRRVVITKLEAFSTTRSMIIRVL